MVSKGRKRQTEVKRASNTINHSSLTSREDNGTFKSVFERVEDYAIMLLDESGNILSWNRGAQLIKGYLPEEILGKNYRIFYTKEDKDIALSENLLEEARKKGRQNYEG